MRLRVFAAAIGLLVWSAAPEIEVRSPDGRVRFGLIPGGEHLTYAIRMADQPVLDPSPLGIVVDGVDLGRGAELGKVETYETYPTRGMHSRAVNRYRGARVAARHPGSGAAFTVDVRAFDDGVAFRLVVPGEGARVPDESSAFRPVAGSTVWSHDLRGHHEWVCSRKQVGEAKAGEWAAVPLTFRLPEGRGYASITEAALGGYAGMALQADGASGFVARLGHAHPASHPYTLRYGEDGARRLAKPAAISGTIATPWRVVMVGADLNTLINCDIVSNVSPPPDPKLFPRGIETDRIKPGRAIWKFIDGGPSTLDGMREFSRLAGELGFEIPRHRGLLAEVDPRAAPRVRRRVEGSRRRDLALEAQQGAADARGPPRVLQDARGRRGRRRQGRLLRPRGEGGRRPLPDPAPRGGRGPDHARLPRLEQDDPAAVAIETAIVTRDDTIAIDLCPGGGFVARFERP